jgi:hypothetical protein
MKTKSLLTVTTVLVLVLCMVGCGPSAAQVQEAMTQTEVALPTLTPTITLTPTQIPTPTVTPTPTETPVPVSPLIDSPIVQIIEDNGFLEQPDLHCIETDGTNDNCNSYDSGALQERVTLYPSGWVEFDVWVNPANANINDQNNMMNKLFSTIWDETMKQNVASLVDMTQSIKDIEMDSNVEGHYVSVKLISDNGQGVPEYVIMVGPSGSGNSLNPTPTP